MTNPMKREPDKVDFGTEGATFLYLYLVTSFKYIHQPSAASYISCQSCCNVAGFAANHCALVVPQLAIICLILAFGQKKSDVVTGAMMAVNCWNGRIHGEIDGWIWFHSSIIQT